MSDALFMSSSDVEEARAQEAAAAPKPLAADESTAEEREVGGAGGQLGQLPPSAARCLALPPVCGQLLQWLSLSRSSLPC